MKNFFLIKKIKKIIKRKKQHKKKISEEEIYNPKGMPEPTSFEETDNYFFYGWQMYNNGIEIRRRDRISGHLQRALILNFSYDILWKKKKDLIYFNF